MTAVLPPEKIEHTIYLPIVAQESNISQPDFPNACFRRPYNQHNEQLASFSEAERAAWQEYLLRSHGSSLANFLVTEAGAYTAETEEGEMVYVTEANIECAEDDSIAVKLSPRPLFGGMGGEFAVNRETEEVEKLLPTQAVMNWDTKYPRTDHGLTPEEVELVEEYLLEHNIPFNPTIFLQEVPQPNLIVEYINAWQDGKLTMEQIQDIVSPYINSLDRTAHNIDQGHPISTISLGNEFDLDIYYTNQDAEKKDMDAFSYTVLAHAVKEYFAIQHGIDIRIAYAANVHNTKENIKYNYNTIPYQLTYQLPDPIREDFQQKVDRQYRLGKLGYHSYTELLRQSDLFARAVLGEDFAEIFDSVGIHLYNSSMDVNKIQDSINNLLATLNDIADNSKTGRKPQWKILETGNLAQIGAPAPTIEQTTKYVQEFYTMLQNGKYHEKGLTEVYFFLSAAPDQAHNSDGPADPNWTHTTFLKCAAGTSKHGTNCTENAKITPAGQAFIEIQQDRYAQLPQISKQGNIVRFLPQEEGQDFKVYPGYIHHPSGKISLAEGKSLQNIDSYELPPTEDGVKITSPLFIVQPIDDDDGYSNEAFVVIP